MVFSSSSVVKNLFKIVDFYEAIDNQNGMRREQKIESVRQSKFRKSEISKWRRIKMESSKKKNFKK